MNRHDHSQIPSHMKKALDLYAKEGVPVGGFLKAVLSNELFEAVGRADDTNCDLIPVYCSYIHNELPCTCHGSPQHYKDWINGKYKE